MFKSISLVMLSLIVLCLGAADMSQAAIRKKKDRPKEPIVVVPHKLSIAPWVVGGKLTGKSGEAADYKDEGARNKIVYGGGLSIQKFFTETTGAGINLGLIWKGIPDLDSGPFRILLYSGSAIFDPYPFHRTAPCFRAELGFANSRYLNYNGSTLTLGTHFFYGVGIELRSYTGIGTKATLALWYREMLTDGHEVVTNNVYTVPFNVTGLGIELSVAIPLKKFPL